MFVENKNPIYVLFQAKYCYLLSFPCPTKEKFDSFVYWLSENFCYDKDKREIANSFDLDDFTGLELLTEVRGSELFSIQMIDAKVVEILRVKEVEVTAAKHVIKPKEDTIRQRDETIKQVEKRKRCSYCRCAFCSNCYNCEFC